jgi:ribonuclease HI
MDAWTSDDDLLFLSLDISKAFDSVWRDGLLYKLRTTLGLSGPILAWLTSFLGERNAYVKIKNYTTNPFPLQNSVPQGSILAATLFAIYIADLPESIKNPHKCALYADDVNILCPISRLNGPLRTAQLQAVQTSLNSITHWGSRWRLHFHKLQLLIFTPHGSDSYNSVPSHTVLHLHGRPINPNQSEPIRLLGVWLDTHLSMKPHIEKIIARVTPRLNFLRSISGKYWGADRPTLTLLYKSWIRPIIEYASPAYSIASSKPLASLDKLQAKALRTIVGTSKTASIVALHSILAIHTLGVRRIRASSKMYAKFQRGDIRDTCIAHWSRWHKKKTKMNHHIPTGNHTSNIYRPLRYNRRHSPYDILLHSAAILQTAQEDNNPEPLLPTDPALKYPTPEPPHPDDTSTPFPKFGTATNRTPQQTNAALAYAQATVLTHQIELPIDGLLIFTDGSVNPDHIGGGGLGILAQRPTENTAWTTSLALPRLSTSFSAELQAIQQALTDIKKHIQTTPSYTTSIVILSDCQSAVHTARQPTSSRKSDYWTSRHTIRELKSHLRQQGVRVRFDWIPGHISFPQNDAVDLSSKLAMAKSRTETNPAFAPNTPPRSPHLRPTSTSTPEPKTSPMYSPFPPRSATPSCALLTTTSHTTSKTSIPTTTSREPTRER